MPVEQNTDLYRDEIADVLMNVLLNSIASVDSGAYLAEYFVPGTAELHARSPGQVRVPRSHRAARCTCLPLRRSRCPATGEPRPSLQSLIHSGLRQAASAFKKTLNLEGRNFRFE